MSTDKISLDSAIDELHVDPNEDGGGENEVIEQQDEELELSQEGEGEQQDADEGEGEGEGESEQEDPYEQLVTVKVDGKDEQVTLREALDGYVRTKTFHQRMSEADVVKRQAEAMVQDIGFRQKHYLDSIEVVKQLIAQEGLDDPKREDYDDVTMFLEAKAAVDARKEKIRQLSAVQADEIQQLQAERLEQLRQKAAVETRAFYEHPHMRGQWKDFQSFKAHMEKTKQWAQERLGYTKQELASIYDHRAEVALTKARLFDEAMDRAKNRVRKKAQGAAPFTIKGNVTASQQQRGPMNGVKRAQAAFHKAPSVESAVDFILAGKQARH